MCFGFDAGTSCVLMVKIGAQLWAEEMLNLSER